MTKANKQIPIYRTKQTTPTDLKNLSGLIFVFCNAIIVMDRRGRRSLQGKIKLPYEKHAFGTPFSLLTRVRGLEPLPPRIISKSAVSDKAAEKKVGFCEAK